jgi:hypothetical protein
MSKRQFKAQASSSRAAFTAVQSPFGTASAGFSNSTSPLSYLNELPDLTSISDANTIVAFKNLSKKDSITKGKALEDLQAILSSAEVEIEDAVLEAWTNIYPRTSIDNSRRVRQLAHSTQGQISLRSGKRIAKYIPKAIGAWLAGLYDNDKLVVKTAADALQQVFATPEKRQALWKAYQQPILEHCQTVFDKESAQTLSDERSVSPDEANAKYYRVVTAAIGLLSNLISSLKEEDYKKHNDEYVQLLQDKKLWGNALSEDAAVRRSTHKTVRILLQSENAKASLDYALMSSVYLSTGLDSDQTGSATEYVETVLASTHADAAVWTTHWSGKRSPQSRLKNFVKRGSQGASLNYWATVSKLFSQVPAAALPTDAAEAQDILKSFYNGVTRKEEPRAYIAAGLRSYVQVAAVLSEYLSEDGKITLLRESVLPLVLQFIRKSPENTKWEIPGPRGAEVVLEAVRIDAMAAAIEHQWVLVSTQIAEDIKSAAAQSGQGDITQDTIIQEGSRYSLIMSALLKSSTTNKQVLEVEAAKLIKEALHVCKQHNGEFAGAASVIASIVADCGPSFSPDSLAIQAVEQFVRNDLPSMYLSPSCRQLSVILFAFNDVEFFQPAWMASLEEVLETPSAIQLPALKELLIPRRNISDSELEVLRSILGPFILEQAQIVLRTGESWSFVVDILCNSNAAAKAAADDVLSAMTVTLLTLNTKEAPSALQGLSLIAKKSPSTLQTFLSTTEGKRLLPNVLLLTESPDDGIAQSASDLNAVLHSLVGDAPTSADAGHSMIEVIKAGLIEAGENSVSVETLVKQALKLVNTDKGHSTAQLLPPSSSWFAALAPFFDGSIPQEFAITHPLAGAVYLVQSTPTNVATRLEQDVEGYSVPLRMAMYTTRLLTASESAHVELHSEVYQLLAITLQIANDNLSIAGSTKLWSINNPETEAEMVEFVAECQGLLTRWLQESDESNESNFIGGATEALLNASNSVSKEAYYNAQAYCTTVGELIELHGWQSRKTADLETQLRALRKEKDGFQMLAFLAAYKVPLATSSVASRYCNELIAELDALEIASNPKEGLRQLILLNAILQNQDTAAGTIAKQRLVRFVRKVVGWLDTDSTIYPIPAELCRALCVLLPSMSDMYGDHWSGVLAYLVSFWNGLSSLRMPFEPALIPLLHAQLRLYNAIRKLKSEETKKSEDERNDDLIEAWAESEQDAGEGLLNMVKLPQDFPDEMHQPLQIFNALLSRQAVTVPLKYLKETEDLYPQIYAPSRSIQGSAYAILHKGIPRNQEQISLDAALEKKTARLPDELLSLILEAPTMKGLESANFDRDMPLSLRGYLFSWMLVFDHFQNSVSASKIPIVMRSMLIPSSHSR